MKTEINTETLICQIVEAEQMLTGVNDRNIHKLIQAIRIIKSESKDLDYEKREHRKIDRMIQKLEMEANNAQTEINLAHYDLIEQDQRKEDEQNTL